MAKSARPSKKQPTESRQTQRIAAILAAAEQVFLEQGYERGSLDDVARIANASKATIYAHFGNKLGLLRAILESRVGMITAPLNAGEISHAPVADVLTAFGRGFLSHLLSPVPLKFYRLMVSEGVHFPDLAQTWFTGGPKASIGRLTEFLKHRADEGELDLPSPALTAEFFLMSLRGTLHLQAASGLLRPPFDKLIDEKVDAAVDMIIRAYGRAYGTNKTKSKGAKR